MEEDGRDGCEGTVVETVLRARSPVDVVFEVVFQLQPLTRERL